MTGGRNGTFAITGGGRDAHQPAGLVKPEGVRDAGEHQDRRRLGDAGLPRSAGWKRPGIHAAVRTGQLTGSIGCLDAAVTMPSNQASREMSVDTGGAPVPSTPLSIYGTPPQQGSTSSPIAHRRGREFSKTWRFQPCGSDIRR